MERRERGKILEIQEGNIRKGGSNTAPTTPHPATSIQGFGPLPSGKANGGPQSSPINKGNIKPQGEQKSK